MRIPLNNIYRAFPELDRFTDEQCERLMQRVRLDSGGRLTSAAAGGFVYFALLVALIIIVFFVVVLPMSQDLRQRYQLLIDLIGLVLVFGLPLLPALLIRDMILRGQLSAAINRHIERVKCLDCSYLLIGQLPREQTVTCPECGRFHTFTQLGITEADLLPPVKGWGMLED